MDKNPCLGRKPTAFWSKMPEGIMNSAKQEWSRWIKWNLSGDELDCDSDDEEAGLLKLYQRMKPDYTFRLNEHGEPILPENWATKGNLASWKHILRSYMKMHYSECETNKVDCMLKI